MRANALLAVCAIAVVCAAGTPAIADTTAIYGGSPSYISLQIPVTASVSSACAFSTPPSGTQNVGELANAYSYDFGFTLQCSSALRVAVVSANGGLVASGVSAATGYTNAAPYNVTLNIAGNSGVTAANATCDAATLTSGAGTPCSFRGPATAAQGLRLAGASNNVSGSYLRVSSAGYSGSAVLLAANTYTDTLTVTLSVSP